jgi:hypothetical protein
MLRDNVSTSDRSGWPDFIPASFFVAVTLTSWTALSHGAVENPDSPSPLVSMKTGAREPAEKAS